VWAMRRPFYFVSVQYWRPPRKKTKKKTKQKNKIKIKPKKPNELKRTPTQVIKKEKEKPKNKVLNATKKFVFAKYSSFYKHLKCFIFVTNKQMV
jgi:hypothetical protein